MLSSYLLLRTLSHRNSVFPIQATCPAQHDLDFTALMILSFPYSRRSCFITIKEVDSCSINPLPFMEPKNSLPCSQGPIAGTYPEPRIHPSLKAIK